METFFFRKLHSLTGLLPAGVFLLFHFTAIGLNIFKANPATVLLLFWLPFLYHVLYGLRIVAHGNPGEKDTYFRLSLVYLFRIDGQYRYYRNYLYLLQRASAYYILVFIMLHILWVQRYPQWLSTPWYQGIFVVGIVAASFHLANGMFGFLSNWGIITGENAHKRVLGFTFCLFIGLCILGMYNFRALYM